MLNLKRLTFFAVLFLVVLRLAIGWQMFYEGLWKYERVGTSEEWSAAGYLKNAQGPLRDRFRDLVDDSDDLDWLDYDKVSARWDEWKDRLIEHYQLTEEQKNKLTQGFFEREQRDDGKDVLRFTPGLDGPKEIVGQREIAQVAPGVRIGGSLAQAIRFDGARKRLVVDGERHLTPRERDILLRDGKRAEQNAKNNQQRNLARQFQAAVKDVYVWNSKLSYRERLKILLKQDPSRVTQVRDDQNPGSVDHKRQGKIDEYRKRLERYNELSAEVKVDYQRDHLQQEWRRIRELHAELVGPVKKLEDDLQTAARKVLTEEQYGQGRVAMSPPGRVALIDKATMWSLMVIGLLLIVGLFSRLTALAGGLLILSFYLAQPPWPGVPQPPGPEHSLIVNKNLLEVLALFALAFIPTGKFFGVDAFFIGLFRGRQDESRKTRRAAASSASSTKKPPTVSPAEKAVSAKPVATSSSPPPLNPAETYAIKPDEKKR